MRHIARHIADPQHARAYGELRVEILDEILATPIRELSDELGKLEPERLIDLWVRGVRSLLDRRDFRARLGARVQALLGEAGDGSLGAWLDQVGLLAVWREATSDFVEQRLRATVQGDTVLLGQGAGALHQIRFEIGERVPGAVAGQAKAHGLVGVTRHGAGIAGSGGPTVEVLNSSFSGGYGGRGGTARDDGTGSWSMAYCNFFDNSGSPFEGLTNPVGSDGNLSEDTEYSDITEGTWSGWDFSLEASSPLIDAGDPSILDTDEKTSDMGMYGDGGEVLGRQRRRHRAGGGLRTGRGTRWSYPDP